MKMKLQTHKKQLATTDTICTIPLCISVLNSSSLFISSAKSETKEK